MPDTHVPTERSAQDEIATYDAIVIGAGISGMFMLYRLRELGMTARVFEAGADASLKLTDQPNPSPWDITNRQPSVNTGVP